MNIDTHAVTIILLGGLLGWSLGPVLDYCLSKFGLQPRNIAIWVLLVIIVTIVILRMKS